MDTQEQQGDWTKLKNRIKTKFSKLSDSDVEGLNGHMDQLPDKVQKIYAYSKDKAEKECRGFN